MLPPKVRSPVIFASPVSVNVAPSNVRFALSSNSPSVPASTTRPAVKSLTVKLGATTSLSISIMPVPAASNSRLAFESYVSILLPFIAIDESFKLPFGSTSTFSPIVVVPPPCPIAVLPWPSITISSLPPTEVLPPVPAPIVKSSYGGVIISVPPGPAPTITCPN